MRRNSVRPKGKRQLGNRRANRGRGDRGRLRVDRGGLRIDPAAAQGRLSRHPLSARLAARRQGFFRPRRRRSHRRARPPRLAGLLRQRVPVAAPVLRRTESQQQGTRPQLARHVPAGLRILRWPANRRTAAGSTGPRISRPPRDFPAIPSNPTIRSRSGITSRAVWRCCGRCCSAWRRSAPPARRRSRIMRRTIRDANRRQGGGPAPFRRAGLSRGRRRGARAGGSRTEVDGGGPGKHRCRS